jgi:hypothetical protein
MSLLVKSVYNAEEFLPLLFRFAINGFFAWILIDRIYFKINKQREYLFTLFVFNVLIFFVASVLSGVKMKTGFAFGLFAIFSILRYRTEQINIKEMTFMFASIIIAVTNSLVTQMVPLVNILFTNVAIIGTIYLLERSWLKSSNQQMEIVFDDVSLIKNSQKELLIAELVKRTELKIFDYEIISINYLRDTAKIIVFYE